MGTTIKRITNANVYLDGTSMLGRCQEATLPELKFKMTDHAALGMFGATEHPAGAEKMEATLKMNGLYAEMQKAAGNPFKSVNLMLRSTQETFTGAGRVAQVPVITMLTGTFKSMPGGSFKAHEVVDASYTLAVTAMKQEIDGVTVCDIDVMNNIFKINGTDILDEYRANLGL